MEKKILILFFVLTAVLTPVSAEAADSATGNVLLYTVMISDSDQNFNNNMMSTVDHHMDRVVNYYKGRAPAEAELSLEPEYHTVSISYSGDYSSDYSHVTKAMNSLGYSGNWNEAIPKLVEQKKKEGYDQVAVVFVAPDTGRSYMRPSGESEFTTVYYFQSESGLASFFEMEDTPSVVYAHELGHILGGEDEYVEEGNTGYGELSDNPTTPMKSLYPSFNYQSGPSPEESVMASYNTWDSLGWFDINTPFSQWARGMIGWRDFDLDGTIDANDEQMPVQFPRDRKPILNARIDKSPYVRYTEFDSVDAESRYDDGSLVNSFGYSLISPSSTRVDYQSVDSNRTFSSANLEADIPDSEKPGNWTVNFLYGGDKAAWYEIEVIAPLVRLSTDTVDLGRVNVEDEGTGRLTVSNEGKMQLVATNPDISTEERVTEEINGFTLSPLSSGSRSFTIRPRETGTISGEISFQTNDPRNEQVSVPFSGFAYAVRHLLASSPSSAKVDEQVPITVEFEDASKTPEGYGLEIRRNGQTVTDANYIERENEFGQTTLTIGKYGDYNVTVDKPDSREYEYRSDSTTFNIERLVKNLQLEMDLSRTQVDPGEKIQITSKLKGQRVQAELLVDGESRGTGQTFTVTLDEPGNHKLRLVKSDVKTDREIRKYQSIEKTVKVSERSFFGGITHFFSSLF
jgi:hypothetical protein